MKKYDMYTACKVGLHLACEQALLFGQAKRASRERAIWASEASVLARPVLLAQTGELASRLVYIN